MQFGTLPFMTTAWDAIRATEHPGASGVARWRTVFYRRADCRPTRRNSP